MNWNMTWIRLGILYLTIIGVCSCKVYQPVEKISFENGESSLFMINSREMSFINAKIKLNELENKWQKSLLEVNFNLGLLKFE